MRGVLLVVPIFLLAAFSVPAQSVSISKEISFLAADSLKIYGDLYHVDHQRPVILLFHQARANGRAEYGELVRTLLDKNYNLLILDQRSGGQVFGNYNRTVAEIPLNRYGYCDAYQDLEGALDFIIGQGYRGGKIIWGSSYSAALVIKLAYNRPQDVAAVLAFSPASGEPMAGCQPNDLLEHITTPLLILRPERETSNPSVQTQLKLADTHGHKTYVVENGVHGSSMMIASRVKDDVSQQWKVVHEFIDQHTKP